MNYSQIRKIDISDGPGIRASLFVSGCTIRCPGCFNSCAWNFYSGKKFTKEIEQKLLDIIKNPNYNGLSILGGEPFDQNAQGIQILSDLCDKVHALGKDVWIWSGHYFEQLNMSINTRKLLEKVDILIDGPFIEKKKDLSLAWRGSINQRVIDVQKSLEEEKIVEYRCE